MSECGAKYPVVSVLVRGNADSKRAADDWLAESCRQRSYAAVFNCYSKNVEGRTLNKIFLGTLPKE
jgi:hypothetical protein